MILLIQLLLEEAKRRGVIVDEIYVSPTLFNEWADTQPNIIVRATTPYATPMGKYEGKDLWVKRFVDADAAIRFHAEQSNRHSHLSVSLPRENPR